MCWDVAPIRGLDTSSTVLAADLPVSQPDACIAWPYQPLPPDAGLAPRRSQLPANREGGTAGLDDRARRKSYALGADREAQRQGRKLLLHRPGCARTTSG